MKYGFFPGCAYKSAAGYEESVDAVNRAVGIELVEIEDWNCCGATAVVSTSEMAALNLAGRLMALADKQGFDQIVTVCNACYATLKKSLHKMEKKPDLIGEVNRHLETEGLTVTRLLPVRHHMDVLIQDVPLEKFQTAAGSRVFDLNIAAYYGCQLTRPYESGRQAERPDRLEKFLSGIGLRVVDHSAKTMCCGAAHMVPYEKNCRPLISRIVGEMARKGGEVITTICPMCQFNLDDGQSGLNPPRLPITYFTQIIGLSLGIASKDLGLNKLLVPMDKVLESGK